MSGLSESHLWNGTHVIQLKWQRLPLFQAKLSFSSHFCCHDFDVVVFCDFDFFAYIQTHKPLVN